MFYLVPQKLVDGERDRLPRRHSHDAWNDSFVQRRKTFMPEHVSREHVDPPYGRLAGLAWVPLQPRLDGIDGRVAQGSHGAADQPNAHGLVARKLLVLVFWLTVLQHGLELRVGGEVDGLVGALAEGRERHAAIQGSDPFFLDHGVERMRGVAVLRNVERVGHGVVLGLQTDLHHLHRCYDGDRLGDARREPSCRESAWPRTEVHGLSHPRMLPAPRHCRCPYRARVACTIRTK